MPCCHMNFKSHIVVAYYYLMRCSHNAHISFFATSTCVSYISFVCEKYESVNCESTIVSKIIMHDTQKHGIIINNVVLFNSFKKSFVVNEISTDWIYILVPL